ncbi:RraA family protein [Agromyces mariniharenae]|uniref:Putative 4-hydroxy-4-methyl-2-oxoglutarate aldolase n=1 Tax=Agromyces mariniharenae TaxID=2604423 RepID=A0A5S4V6A9_9MICO|nr:RraA family protein [Agromyces mariniharenae]TYL53383.1 RraA family protein [Agromyces mariniharenae]
MSIEIVPPTAAVADAALRLGVEARLAPVSLRSLLPTAPIAGPARPVTHLGSVDVLLETIDDAPPGTIMVVDNGGRLDEACVGDLMVLEAERAGLAGMVIWGLHRDTAQLREIGLPVFSLGACPYGPRRVPPAGRRMASAVLDGVTVGEDDHVFADDDGVLVVASVHVDALVETALAIQRTETAQADRMRRGESLRAQLDFAGYRARQAADPELTLRRHLTERGGAIEV